MKIMSYNILNGGGKRLPMILKTIKAAAPDFLAIQEANGFKDHDNQTCDYFAQTLGLPFYEISPAYKYAFDVVSFSKYPLRKILQLPLKQNAVLFTTVTTEFGELVIINCHPCPYTDSDRLVEMETIFNYITPTVQTILLGDFNSLAATDSYPENIVELFNDKHKLKYTVARKLSFRVTDYILQRGFVDVAKHLGKNHGLTAPTGQNLPDETHTIPYDQPPVRLDYFFVSKKF